jgi:iron-sulfur cluster repair protein YtfE (RIC family)
MENNSDLEFLLMFTNYPNIDRNSFTTIEYICNKYYNIHPADAREWIEEAVKQGLIEEVREDSPLGKLKCKTKYKITNKGLKRYMYSEEV